MIASYKAIDLIKRFEGCKLDSYQDPKGIWTIGYGQTGPNIGPGLKITTKEAEDLLVNHLARLQEQLSHLVTAPLKQNQFDALTSLVYNIGITKFSYSTLLKKLNRKEYDSAAAEILRWDHIDGVESPGLLVRRSAEYSLFHF